MPEERDRLVGRLARKYGNNISCEDIAIMQKEQELEYFKLLTDIQKDMLHAIYELKSAIHLIVQKVK